MKKEIFVSATPLETRVALTEDGLLAEYYQEHVERAPVVGNIYLAKVKDVVPGMDAAFVDIGLQRSAFLHVSDLVGNDRRGRRIEKILASGQKIVVQVTKKPTETKGARVTGEITIAGRQLVYLPFSSKVAVSRRLPEQHRDKWRTLVDTLKVDDGGIIIRTAATRPDLGALKRELSALSRLWRQIESQAERVNAPFLLERELELALRVARDFLTDEVAVLFVDSQEKHRLILKYLQRLAPHLKKKVALYQKPTPLFRAKKIEKDLKHGLDRRVWLRSGGYLTIDTAEALTAIDVNTGRFVGKSKLSDTILKTNLEAAREIPRQLRLRDIGGIIVVDFIDMAEEQERADVFLTLQEALARDRSKIRLMEISRLGLVELTRKRVSQGLYSLMKTCPTCEGQGRVISLETEAVRAYRHMAEILMERQAPAYIFGVAPPVYRYLEDREDYLKQFRRQYRKCALLVPNDSLKDGAVELVAEGTLRQLKTRWKKLLVV